ncbi:MAG: hypothetical protein IT355_06600 [Gemmatimonadaceae bacterium]|nr:hypothetical protein [Gemmatimonadaceae bacterium]
MTSERQTPGVVPARDRLSLRFARYALGAGFLSAVAARLGLWHGHLSPERFAAFVTYTGDVNAFLPRAAIPAVAVAATLAESVLGIALLCGVLPRLTGLASAALLLAFGTAMAISYGVKEPLDYSVFAAAGAALLVAIHPAHDRRPAT